MAFVHEVLVNDEQLVPHSWDAVRAEILCLRSRPHTTIFLGGRNGQMMMEFVEDKGYYISSFGEGELEEWLAVDSNLSGDWIEVDISGHVDDVPRRVLVSEAIALDVAKEFYGSGKRTQGQSWVKQRSRCAFRELLQYLPGLRRADEFQDFHGANSPQTPNLVKDSSRSLKRNMAWVSQGMGIKAIISKCRLKHQEKHADARWRPFLDRSFRVILRKG